MQNVSFGAIRGFLKDEAAAIQKAAECIHNLQLLPEEPENESERAEAVCELLAIASDAQDRHITMTLVRILLAINQTCGNHAEAAFALAEMLALIPCTDEADAGVQGFSSTNGRQLHAEVLTKMAEFLIEDGYEEYALPFLDRLVSTCVRPYRHVELMPGVTSLRGKVFQRITAGKRSFSRYFWVTCSGPGFPAAWSNRSWVYRRPPAKAAHFVNDLQAKFPGVATGSDPAPSPNAPYIRILEVRPSSLAEVSNFLAQPSFNMPKYIAEFRSEDHVSVFRSEIRCSPNTILSELTQNFIAVAETFPTKVRRVAVDGKRSKSRTLSPLEHATLEVARLNHRLSSNLHWYHHDAGADAQVVERLDEAVSEVSLSLTLPQTLESGTLLAYLEEFVEGENPKNEAQAKALAAFKAVVQEQADIVPQVMRLNPPATLPKEEMALLTAIAALTEKAFQTYIRMKTKLVPLGFKSAATKAPGE
jgi:hypothetical protein